MKNLTVQDVAQIIRTAKDKVNALYLADQQKPKNERLAPHVLSQQLGAIIFDGLHDVGLYTEDAYNMLYAYSFDTESDEYAEELAFLEHVLGGN